MDSIRLHILAFICLLAFSCRSNNPVRPEGSVPPEQAGVTIVSAAPKSPTVGDTLTIVLHGANDSSHIIWIYLNGVSVYGSYTPVDTLTFVFPYIAHYKGIFLSVGEIKPDSTYQLEVPITPIIDTCSSPVCVQWAKSNIITISNPAVSWQAVVSGDTVTLQEYDGTADYFEHQAFAFLTNGDNQLPTFLSNYMYSYPPRWQDTLRSGLILIDQWHPHGIISGRIHGSDENLNFYQFHRQDFYLTIQ